jgi:hypothetical protein
VDPQLATLEKLLRLFSNPPSQNSRDSRQPGTGIIQQLLGFSFASILNFFGSSLGIKRRMIDIGKK